MRQMPSPRSNGHMPTRAPRAEMGHPASHVSQPPIDQFSPMDRAKNLARSVTLNFLGRVALPYAMTVTLEASQQAFHFLPGLNIDTPEMMFIYGPVLGLAAWNALVQFVIGGREKTHNDHDDLKKRVEIAERRDRDRYHHMKGRREMAREIGLAIPPSQPLTPDDQNRYFG